MKLYQLIATTAMAVLALAGCNKNEAEAPEEANPDAGMKEVSISISGLATKGQIDPSSPWAEDIANIAEFDIYFTSASGVIKYAYTFKSDNEYSDAYNEFKKGGSVRFIGLQDISGVYVAANTTTKLGAEDKINEFGTVFLENYNSDIKKENVLYVGGDIDLTPIESEPVDGVTVNVPNDETMASQSYTANIYLRPVISRIEIGDVYVETSGEHTITVGEGTDDEKTYKYTWNGFTPKLVGIYMSNVAGTLDPMAHTVSEWFTKPTGTQIEDGKWNDNITYLDGTDEFEMSTTGMNVEKVLWYSNYSDNAYSDLFASNLGKDETVGSYTHHYYFNGADADPETCVPFNFFVPFDVTDETNTTKATAIWTGAEGLVNGNNPALHFQFDFSDQTTGTPYNYSVTDITNGEPGTPIPEGSDLWVQLTSRINFTTVSDDIYYANVTSFKKGVEDINVAPNSIYKLTGVGITPFNLTTGTETVEEDYNIIVKVTTVPYVIEEVTPSFDNE